MDIVIVTYNSEKWIKRCLDSLLKAKALSSDLKLFFVDNHSSDQTVELLTAYEKKDDFSRFEIIQQEQNQGFGNANNLGASFGDSNAIVHLAIVYKKPFIAILSRNKKKSLEVISTLEQLGLEERIIFVEDDVKEKSYLYKKPIKYGVVDYKLKAFIEHSKEWLGKCLE